MSNSDSASISINFNLPPSIIKEYFDGMAKVENAKHSPYPETNIFESLVKALSLVLPVVMPMSTGGYGCNNVIVAQAKINQDEVKTQEWKNENDSENEDNVVEESKVEENKAEESKVEEIKVEKNKVEEKPTKRKKGIKKPLYNENENMNVKLKEFAETFSGNGGFSDVIKMVGPMMEEIMGQTSLKQMTPVQETDKTSKQTNVENNAVD